MVRRNAAGRARRRRDRGRPRSDGSRKLGFGRIADRADVPDAGRELDAGRKHDARSEFDAEFHAEFDAVDAQYERNAVARCNAARDDAVADGFGNTDARGVDAALRLACINAATCP